MGELDTRLVASGQREVTRGIIPNGLRTVTTHLIYPLNYCALANEAPSYSPSGLKTDTGVGRRVRVRKWNFSIIQNVCRV